MTATMHVERIHFCYVHGYAHPDGEMDADETMPVGVIEPDGSVLECHDEEWDVVTLDADEYEVKGDEVGEQVRGFHTLKAGDMAFIYTVRGGLVPCKVLEVLDNRRTTIRVTADRIGWRRGAVEVIRNPHVSLVARTQVSIRSGQVRVNGALAMLSDSGTLLR